MSVIPADIRSEDLQTILSFLHPEVQAMLEPCFAADPTERCSTLDLIADPIFDCIRDLQLENIEVDQILVKTDYEPKKGEHTTRKLMKHICNCLLM